MKRYLKNYTITKEIINRSIYKCLNNRRWTRKDTSYMFAEYYIEYCVEHQMSFQNIHTTARKIRNLAYRAKTKLYKLVDYIVDKIYIEITTHTIKLKPINYEKRKDKSSEKEREIGISSMKQQLYDYIAVDICENMFNAKIGYYQCASLRGKGQLFGKKTIECWIKKNPKKCRYVFKADIKKYYDNVNHKNLKKLLTRDIKNKEVLYILYTLIDTYKIGLCIGSYLSQYLANYYLSYLYHFIENNCYKTRRNKKIRLVTHTLFYMDDVLLFGYNKRDLKRATKMIINYLEGNLNLEFKKTYQLFPLNSRPIDMLGFKIYTYKTTIRKRVYKRIIKCFKNIKRKNKITLEIARKLISYNGFILYTYSAKLRKKYNYEEKIEKAKEVISYATSSIFKQNRRKLQVYEN